MDFYFELIHFYYIAFIEKLHKWLLSLLMIINLNKDRFKTLRVKQYCTIKYNVSYELKGCKMRPL